MEFNFLKKKRGFTLVELLIVIAIIGLLSLMSVNGYISYRRAVIVNLSADNIVSQIYEMKEAASYGRVGGDRFGEITAAVDSGEELSDADLNGAQCYGLYFADGKIGTFRLGFSNKKIFDQGKYVFESCEEFESGLVTYDGPVDAKLGFEVEEFVLTFVPPFGEVALSDGIVGDEFEIEVSSGEGDSYVKKVLVDLKTGKPRIE